MHLHLNYSKAPDEEVEVFYEDVEKAQNITKDCSWKIVMGDWNSKIGAKASHENGVMGSYCYGTRNKRSERRIQFCRKNELFITNTMFKKRIQRK